MESSWLVYSIAFIAIDFASYWNHRLSHKINFFWNQHVIHHSSEEFNLACALRQSISNLLGYFPILLLPAALVGIPHQVIAFLASDSASAVTGASIPVDCGLTAGNIVMTREITLEDI